MIKIDLENIPVLEKKEMYEKSGQFPYSDKEFTLLEDIIDSEGDRWILAEYHGGGQCCYYVSVLLNGYWHRLSSGSNNMRDMYAGEKYHRGLFKKYMKSKWVKEDYLLEERIEYYTNIENLFLIIDKQHLGETGYTLRICNFYRKYKSIPTQNYIRLFLRDARNSWRIEA